MKKYFALIFIICFLNYSFSQDIRQTIKGIVIDQETELPIPGASIVLTNTNPLIGSTTDINGKFTLENIPIGNYNFEISSIGYKSTYIQNKKIESGKQVVLNIRLVESVNSLKEIFISSDNTKNRTLNKMAVVSATRIRIKEAAKYAGANDDPARLASSFAGVATNGQSDNNSIVIRGNSPKSLLWRLEGVEITNPNHFADINSFGAGGLTALSSLVLANSDFFTGAFPAEYGNALSGVFDIHLRTGNSEKREYAFQLGALGIDISSEGPFKKGKESSYLFNYRYSTLSLLESTLPEDAKGTSYQDLSFKLNFPTEKSGTFSLWSLGAIDKSGTKADLNENLWEYDDDKTEANSKQFMGALGLNHKIWIGNKSRINSSLSISGNGIKHNTKRLNEDLDFIPFEHIKSEEFKLTFSSYLHHKFNAKHSNRTGFILNNLNYTINLEDNETLNETPLTIINENGNSNFYQFYSQSKFRFSEKLTLNAGLYGQYFRLNNKYSIEPRIGVSYKTSLKSSINFGYGLHSRKDRMPIYFAKQEINQQSTYVNKDLDFIKSHHFITGFKTFLGKKHHLTIEVYYQNLFNVPVIENSYFSIINMDKNWFFNENLVNKGKGTNYGVDITLERYLNDNFYYLITTSIFDSTYEGGDGIKRNTKYNKGFVFNFLAGKEWKVGKNYKNTLGVNGKFTFQNGNKISPLNYDESISNKSVIFDYSNAYNNSLDKQYLASFSINYRKNKRKHASIWSLNVINALGFEEFNEYRYNHKTNSIDAFKEKLIIPNISYKIEF